MALSLKNINFLETIFKALVMLIIFFGNRWFVFQNKTI